MMNRVFTTEHSIDVEIMETPAAAAASPKREPAAKAAMPRTRPHWTMDPTMALSAALGIAGLALTGITLTGLGLRSQHQQALQQERNMLLVERLRSLASQDPAAAAAPPGEAQDSAPSESSELPSPPPDEPCMEELNRISNKRSGRMAVCPQAKQLQSITAVPTGVHLQDINNSEL